MVDDILSAGATARPIATVPKNAAQVLLGRHEWAGWRWWVGYAGAGCEATHWAPLPDIPTPERALPAAVLDVAASILEALRANPSQWGQTQGTSSLVGLIAARTLSTEHPRRLCQEFMRRADFEGDMGDWERAPGRTVEDVKSLCERVVATL